MSNKSESVIVCRKPSDCGKVFPSGVRIGKTSYGLGVFAFAFVPEGTPIARISGHVIRDSNYSSDYCIDAGEGKVLEPAPPFCYLNHSCEPNCLLMHYVREKDADESEGLASGVLTEEEMDFEDECDLTDDDCVYGCADSDDIGGIGDIGVGVEVGVEEETDPEEQLFEDDADAEIWIESILDILPDEELTIDYSWTADRAAKCLCGKPSCRGWIVDPAERNLLPDH